MADAVYYHASLFAFDEEARREVVRRVNEKLQNITIKCTYDDDLQLFSITCPPGGNGPEADELLSQIIELYVQEERKMAESDDRPPHVQRLKESTFEFFDIDSADPAVMAERTAARSTSQGSVHHQPAHCLSGELAASAKLKAFRLREMPTGVLERTLSSTHPNVKKAIAAGFRLRAVRWSSNDDAYVFNSRLGQPIFIDQVETLEVYNTTSFPIMEDNRPGFSSRPRPIQAASVQHFKFNGPQPTVQQFLVGMGDVELEDPNAKPVPTEEARQYMQRPEFGPTATTGRARVPRARAQSTSSSDDKSDSDFGDGNVFESQGATQQFDSDGEVPEDDAVPFDTLLSASAQRPPRTSMLPPTQDSTYSNVAASALAENWSPAPASQQTIQQTASIAPTQSTSFNTLPEYGPRGFTKVDKIGLTTNPGQQAEWELEINSPRKPKINRSGVVQRITSQPNVLLSPLPTSRSDMPMSLSTGPDIHAYQSSQAASGSAYTHPSTTTSTVVDQAQMQSAPWAARPYLAQVPEGRLVDDSVSISGNVIMPPPGLDLTNNAAPTPTRPSRVCVTPTSTRNSSVKSQAAVSQASTSRVAIEQSQTWKHSASEDEGIREKLQQPIDKTTKKHNTMRQKAKKKGGTSGKQNNQARPNVQLPKPDQPPPPKARKPAQTTATPLKAIIKPEQAASGSKAPQKETRAKPSSPSSGRVSRMLANLAKKHDITTLQVKAFIGAILVRAPRGEDIYKGVHNAKVFDQRLLQHFPNFQTEFLRRLTTSEVDAQYVLSRINSNLVLGAVHFEVHTKDLRGVRRLIRFAEPVEKKTGCRFRTVKVFLLDTELATTYIHYPQNVWDAQVVVSQGQMDDSMQEECKAFVDSVETLDVPPSFEAQYPINAFTVERVLAKRVFAKRVDSGVVVKVVEVQDMQIEAGDSPYHNMNAISLSRNTMIQEQRLWWEASMYLPQTSIKGAEALQDLLDKTVVQLDGVGYNNQGPWEAATVPRAKSDGSEPGWYW